MRRLEVEEWDKERMRHFYYGLYGMGPWYWDMEERLHNPFFIGARGWNGPPESWIGENQVCVCVWAREALYVVWCCPPLSVVVVAAVVHSLAASSTAHHSLLFNTLCTQVQLSVCNHLLSPAPNPQPPHASLPASLPAVSPASCHPRRPSTVTLT